MADILIKFGFDVVARKLFNVFQKSLKRERLVKMQSSKAQLRAWKTGLPAIADDSGLGVDTLMVHPVSTQRVTQVKGRLIKQNIWKLLDCHARCGN